MTRNFPRSAARTALAIAALMALRPALADDDRLSLHGFGNQDYWKSTANSFEQSGTGTWNNDFLGLVASVKINDQSKLWAQLQASSTENVRFTWMFVDYQITDQLRAQVGRVKFPYGIYNEYIDTRALQMSVGIPLAYSGEADMAYDAYNGVGLAYDADLKSAGHLGIQAFLGNIYTPPPGTFTPPYPAQYQMQNEEANTVDRHVIGGKLTWETPVEGLRLMVSGNQTRVASIAQSADAALGLVQQGGGQQGAEDRFMLSADYVRDEIDLKAEYNFHKYPGLEGFGDQVSHAWYVQAGFPLGAWTPYVRYDAIVTDGDEASDPSYYQHTAVIGINRRIMTNLNFRVEDEFNHGYAMPVAAGETLAGNGKVNWQMFAASINFMF